MDALNDGRRTSTLILMFGALALWVLLGCSTTSAAVQTGQTGQSTASAEEPECKLQSNGTNVCGYHCKTGSNGRVYCADTPDGQCAMNSDGTYSCTQLADSQRGAVASADGPEPECKLQSNGRKVCGYNCRLGSNGLAYCSSIPNGTCSLNSDGTFSCP